MHACAQGEKHCTVLCQEYIIKEGKRVSNATYPVCDMYAESCVTSCIAHVITAVRIKLATWKILRQLLTSVASEKPTCAIQTATSVPRRSSQLNYVVLFASRWSVAFQALQTAVYTHLTRVKTTISTDFSHDISASVDVAEATSEPEDVYYRFGGAEMLHNGCVLTTVCRAFTVEISSTTELCPLHHCGFSYKCQPPW